MKCKQNAVDMSLIAEEYGQQVAEQDGLCNHVVKW
jgi:hypothetical protein